MQLKKRLVNKKDTQCEMPSSLPLQCQLFRTYKEHSTPKSLVGLTPNEEVTFLFNLYEESINDREIVPGEVSLLFCLRLR